MKWSKEHREEARKRAKEQYYKIKTNPIRWAKREATRKTYNKRNANKLREHHRKYEVDHRRKSIQAKIRHNLRNRLWIALLRQNARKQASTSELVGCSISDLIIYLEKQFKPGMSWDNRSEFHIDHKLPLNWFDLTDIEQQKKAFHYTNLQPLWAKDNMQKGSKLWKAKR